MKQETALELTLAAIEKGVITFIPYHYNDNEEAENQNAFNAKQISDFYNALTANLSPEE